MADGPADPAEVSVVIPSWNDHDRLARTLNEYVPALEAGFARFEIIVVSDGVKEPTRALVTRYSNRSVTVLEFPRRLGKGGAVLAGLRAARYSVAGFIDADGPLRPDELVTLIREVGGRDGAIASRTLAGSSVEPPRPWLRHVLSRGWNLAARVVLGLPFSDTQCGAKFFRLATLRQVLDGRVLNDWGFDTSILVQLARHRATIAEVPVSWRESYESKVDLPSIVPRMILCLMVVRFTSLRRLVGSDAPVVGRITDQSVDK